MAYGGAVIGCTICGERQGELTCCRAAMGAAAIGATGSGLVATGALYDANRTAWDGCEAGG